MPGGCPTILFRDQRFVVLDKPAGLPVHAGPSGGPSVEDWFRCVAAEGRAVAGASAGCRYRRVFGDRAAKAALVAAQALFASGKVRKTYWAVVAAMSATHGTVTAPLRRVATSAAGEWWSIRRRPGRGHRLARAGPQRMALTWLETAAPHRPHPPDPGALRALGTSNSGRRTIWRRRRRTASAGPGHPCAAGPAGRCRGRAPPHMLAALEQCGFRA